MGSPLVVLEGNIFGGWFFPDKLFITISLRLVLSSCLPRSLLLSLRWALNLQVSGCHAVLAEREEKFHYKKK